MDYGCHWLLGSEQYSTFPEWRNDPDLMNRLKIFVNDGRYALQFLSVCAYLQILRFSEWACSLMKMECTTLVEAHYLHRVVTMILLKQETNSIEKNNNMQTNNKSWPDLFTYNYSPAVHKHRITYFHQRQLFELDEIVRKLIDDNCVLVIILYTRPTCSTNPETAVAMCTWLF